MYNTILSLDQLKKTTTDNSITKQRNMNTTIISTPRWPPRIFTAHYKYCIFQSGLFHTVLYLYCTVLYIQNKTVTKFRTQFAVRAP